MLVERLGGQVKKAGVSVESFCGQAGGGGGRKCLGSGDGLKVKPAVFPAGLGTEGERKQTR